MTNNSGDKVQQILQLLEGVTVSEAFEILHRCERKINSISIISPQKV